MQDWHAHVIAAQNGDLAAFEQVVRRFQDMAVAYAYSILQDFSLAEDAAQEAFVQAYYDLAALREPQAFPAWFRRIVFKQCDRLTRRKRVPTVSLEANPELADPGWNPLDVIQQRELQDAVLSAVNELPEHGAPPSSPYARWQGGNREWSRGEKTVAKVQGFTGPSIRNCRHST